MVDWARLTDLEDTGVSEAITDPDDGSQSPPTIDVSDPLDVLARAVNPSSLNTRPISYVQHVHGPITQRKTQTIEKTSKFWKGNMVLGGFLTCAGIASLFYRPFAAKHGLPEPGIPPLLWQQCTSGATLIGFAWYLLARAGAWGFHG
jgi:hypothetical protein